MIKVAQKTDIQRKLGESGFKSWRGGGGGLGEGGSSQVIVFQMMR